MPIRATRRSLTRSIAISALFSAPLVFTIIYPYYKSQTAGSQASLPDNMASAALRASGKDGLTLNVLRAVNRETRKTMDMRAKAGADSGRPKQVALFVGATSGLGLATLRKWVELVGEEGGRAYFVGRNKDAAAKITEDLHRLNPHAQVEFIHTPDVAVLSNAASIASTIASKESHLNLLVLSQGLLSLSNERNPTPDGIERKMATNVYSRFIITRRLLPLLLKAQEADQATPGSAAAPCFTPPRVMSILAPGTEGVMNEEDMELSRPESFSNAKCAAQACAMNSLAMEHLAKEYPEMGWLHVYPEVVLTGITRDLPVWMKAATPLMRLFAVKESDVGEGLGWLATRKEKGLQLVDWRGRSRDTRVEGGEWWGKFFGMGGRWWREGLAEVVWRNVEEVEGRVLGAGK